MNTIRKIDKMTVRFDEMAGEVIIYTPQGMITINRCTNPNITRVVILSHQSGYVSVNTESPVMLCMWGAPLIEEPLPSDDDTEQYTPLFDEIDVGE